MSNYRLLMYVGAAGLIACVGSSQSSPVSIPALSSSTAAGGSLAPILSGDGKYVVFVSRANNIVASDVRPNALDIFVRELATAETRLLTTAAGSGSDRPYVSIADDGQTIVFSSEVNDGPSQLFAYRRGSGLTTLVSTAHNSSAAATVPPGGPGYDGTVKPRLSGNGRWVTFQSTATNLVADDTNNIADIFLRDLETGETLLISAGAQGSPRDRSFGAALAETGARVAFVSTAGGLVPGFSNVLGEIYVRDVASGRTFRGSSNVTSYLASATNAYSCITPEISSNGAAVTFKVKEGERILVFHHNLETEVTTLLSSNGVSRTMAAMTEDGQRVAFEDSQEIMIWDAASNARTVISAGYSAAVQPVLTPNGTTIAFIAKSNVTDKFQLYFRDLQSGVTRLVSFNNEGAPSKAGVDTLPTLSSNGRRIAFDYPGHDLSFNDVNRASDVFLFDADLNSVELISRALPNHPSLTSASWTIPHVNSITDDGRRVAFASYDMPGIGIDINFSRDAFVADLQSGSIIPLSVLANNLFSAEYRVRQPLISGNGEGAIFLSQTNEPPLAGVIDRGAMRLFYRNLTLGTTEEVDPEFSFASSSQRTATFPAISTDSDLVCYEKNGRLYARRMSIPSNVLVSVRWDGSEFINRPPAVEPVFNPDGRWIAFKYVGVDLLPTPSSPPLGTNLYARDLLSNSTKLLSVGESGERLLGSTYQAVFYEASRLIFWGSYGTNEQAQGATTRGYIHDLAGTNSTLVCLNCTSVTASSDGRWIAFARPQGPFHTNLYLRDVSSGTETLITRSRFSSAQANGSSFTPTISGNGRYVIYGSTASNLTLQDTNNAPDIFAYDRLRHSTLILTPNANGASGLPIMAGDGRTVVFQSLASNLVPGDYNGGLDVFFVRLGAGDSDNDGLDDNWEMTYFSGLQRDGTGDLDQDQQSDLAEYLSGTDPTNAGSVFEVLTIRVMNSDAVQVIWASVPNRRYVVQRKQSLADPNWTSVSPEIAASDVSSFWTDNAAHATAFYRVVTD
jgi:Tol biopolymer transport system component